MPVRKKSRFKKIFLRSKKRGRPKKNKPYIKLIIALLIIFITIPSIVGYMWFKKNILDKVPDVSNIEDVVFSQTTKITDKNGELLYRVFDENRKYVGIDDISSNAQNAIIAIEDKGFWENPWIDLSWIARAWIQDIFFGKRQWGSTLTQQLIKNLLLTNDRTITRKLKEVVLAFQLNDYLTEKVNKQYRWLTQEQAKKKVKENILEMYLNYVFFGNNSYGIQAASQTYFKKDSNNLTILESSILASIPKSPVNYNPILNRENNLWELNIYSASWDRMALTWNFKDLVKESYISYLEDQTFVMLKSEQDIINALSPDNLYYKNTHIRYTPWRKDHVLARMYIDSYIDKTQLIQALKESFDKKIHAQRVDIKAPHFVFSVLKELEEQYWKELIEKAWWTIQTSLDLDIQKIAEKSVSSFSWYLADKWANNSSLLYVDSTNWDVIAYVWSQDYYNKDIDWQVDIIKAKRQSWSVMKPLIYTKAFIENNRLTPDTPIYDTEFDIAEDWNTFNNFDWEFDWIMPIKKALAHSRNIPAAKMYFLWGWETKVKNFLQSIGLDTISDNVYYGYPLSIWATEVRMIDMAQAYSNLSNIDSPVDINPILKITWPNGNLIYEKKPKQVERIIPKDIVSFLWYILSNPNHRPSWWNSIMQIAGLNIATKSWTTNIIDPKTWRKLPRDGWFIWYTPSKVFVSWAGNTKWEPMNADSYGGWTAWKVWNDFVKRLKEKELIQKETMSLKGTTSIYVNTINGKRSSKDTPVQVSSKTIARTDGIPLSDDWQTVSMIKIDTMCNGLVSKYTPKEDEKYAYIIKDPLSHRPNDGRWQEPVDDWWNEKWKKEYENIFKAPVLLKEPTEICKEREVIAEKWQLEFTINYPNNNNDVAKVFDLWLQINNTPFDLKTVEIYLDNKLVQSWNYENNIVWVYLDNKTVIWVHNMKVKLIDEKWYSQTKQITINVLSNDNKKPFLDEIRERWEEFIYVFKDENSRVLWWKLYCDGDEKRFKGSIAIWSSKNCDYDVIDYYWNWY